MALFSSTIDQLHNGLDGAELRQNTTANNIANADTPNYKAKKANFEHMLDDARRQFDAQKTDGRHVDFSEGDREAYTSVDRSRSYNHNGNSVDMDKEMAEMANNQIYQSALVDRMDGQFGNLKTALGGQ
ncbi:flagellar basal body rod protein FlgB [Salicibibacter cibi]|uniref:Flagellar basal body rod protein FlgB n=1 Tax=Salicibibacter cibi TaxID=2743001 RepID=A0A7T6ZB45_9BACI|nr:flagellar basal body rod protein FlgB [Salicibibacter cibi]QQK80259.1 flagellar basal body rod protein FlgB [Salicibibacter cibi]